MIFVMTEEVPESGGEGHAVTAGEARCFPSSHVTSLLTVSSDPAWGGDTELWEGGNTQARLERGHKDMSSAPMSPITPLSALEPSVPPPAQCSGRSMWAS